MSENIDDHDVALLGELRELHELVDPPAADLADRVKIAMTVAALHAEIAEIVSTPLVAARDDVAAATQTITFASGDLALMITLSNETPTTVTLDGWVTAPGARIDVHMPSGVVAVDADEHGRFEVEGIVRGRTWFVVWPEGPDGGAVPMVTPTVDL